MTTQKLESIIELASVLARQSDFQEILRLITRKASVLFDAETALIKVITTGPKVKLDDGSQEEHKIIKTKDAGEQKNLVQWILSH